MWTGFVTGPCERDLSLHPCWRLPVTVLCRQRQRVPTTFQEDLGFSTKESFVFKLIVLQGTRKVTFVGHDPK